MKRPEDIDAYDRAFDAFWLGAQVRAGAEVRSVQEFMLAIDVPAPEADEDAAPELPRDVPVLALRWSPTEVLRHADFAAYTSAEFAEARKLMADLRLVGRVEAVAPAAAEHEAARHARRAAHGAQGAAHGR